MMMMIIPHRPNENIAQKSGLFVHYFSETGALWKSCLRKYQGKTFDRNYVHVLFLIYMQASISGN